MQTSKVIDHIVQWLDAYVKNANLNGFVVGVRIVNAVDGGVVSWVCGWDELRDASILCRLALNAMSHAMRGSSLSGAV